MLQWLTQRHKNDFYSYLNEYKQNNFHSKNGRDYNVRDVIKAMSRILVDELKT